MRLIYPQLFTIDQQFTLNDKDLEFLRFWMSRSTLESSSPNYDDGDHWDSYGKFFIYGDQKGKMTDQIRIYNKVGYAYGTLTDVAYIHDKSNNRNIQRENLSAAYSPESFRRSFSSTGILSKEGLSGRSLVADSFSAYFFKCTNSSRSRNFFSFCRARNTRLWSL